MVPLTRWRAAPRGSDLMAIARASLAAQATGKVVVVETIGGTSYGPTRIVRREIKQPEKNGATVMLVLEGGQTVHLGYVAALVEG